MKMNDRNLMRIKIEHEETKEEVIDPLCFRCGEPTTSSIIEIDCDMLDRWGGICGSRPEKVPVWKCLNNHITHIVMME